jgi:hypothetical protein
MIDNLRSQVIDDLSCIVSELQEPFSSALSSEGWSSELWEKWGRIFGDLLESVRSGGFGLDASISRAMDFDGVTQGEILEKAARISNSLRELRRNE